MKHELYLSGGVTRWHTDPVMTRLGQTNGHHQWGVAVLIACLHPEPTARLLTAALLHDAGERLTGDMNYPFKQTNPRLAHDIELQGERWTAGQVGFDPFSELGERDRNWLEMCDRLESWLFVALHVRERLQRGAWYRLRESLVDQASALGVVDKVVALMQEAVQC